MPSLLEAQRSFARALLEGGEGLAAGLSVYRNNVLGNLSGALASAYPIVRKIVGAEIFNIMAREYARAHPSASGNLNEYGVRLPGFVAAYAHTQDLPYLPDVARMEWLAHLAHFAADPMPFDPARLAGLPSARHAALRLSLAPAAALLRSDWPLARLWEVHQDGYAGEFSVDLHAGPERVLVHRPRWRAEVRPIGLGDYRFLAGAGRAEALGDALAAAVARDASFDCASALARWVQAGTVTL